MTISLENCRFHVNAVEDMLLPSSINADGHMMSLEECAYSVNERVERGWCREAPEYYSSEDRGRRNVCTVSYAIHIKHRSDRRCDRYFDGINKTHETVQSLYTTATFRLYG